MKAPSPPSPRLPRSAVALLLGLLLAAAGASAAAAPEAGTGAPAATELGVAADAVLARVNGTPVTVGAVREIQLVTGADAKGIGAALDVAIDSRLFHAEARRRGLDRDPAVTAAIARNGERLLLEQYVLATRPGELRKTHEPGIHSTPAMTGPHAGVMSDAAQLKEAVSRVQKAAYERAVIEYFPNVYQNQNWSGLPRGQLAVARVAGEVILWSEVEELAPAVRGLEPPLTGMTAFRFVNGIKDVAGQRLARREAEEALPGFRAAYDQARERLERSEVTRRLLALEVDAKVSLGEAELQAYFEAHRDKYATTAGPATFEQARVKVARDAERDAKAALRATLAKGLRAAAKIEIDKSLLESLGK